MAVSQQPLTAQAQVQFQASPCGICRRQCGIGTGLSPSTSVFSLPQYHSTNAAASIVHLSLISTTLTTDFAIK